MWSTQKPNPLFSESSGIKRHVPTVAHASFDVGRALFIRGGLQGNFADRLVLGKPILGEDWPN